jgi:predicted O-methyltransferase YrrM
VKKGTAQRVSSFWKWLMQSVSWQSIHSPWLFDLLVAMRDPEFHNADIEACRTALKANRLEVPRVDYGAGSTGNIQTISAIARRSLKRPKHARALAALTKHLQATAVLEMGTSLGITTAYIAAHCEQVCTLEGNPTVAAAAQRTWRELNINNIAILEGPFDETLKPALNASDGFDLIFIDGNHRGKALRSYIDQCRDFLSPSGAIVCDDIHWSSDMESAWKEICNQPEWTLCVDFFEWGLLTRNPNLKREMKAIRF